MGIKATQHDRLPGLMDEESILLYPALAVRAGINKAAILQQIHFYLQVARKAKNTANFIDGRWWVWNTYQQWRKEHFPWLSVSTIKRLFLELEADGIVISRPSPHDPSDQTKYYTIAYERWVEWYGDPSQNKTGTRTKKGRGASQNETGPVSKESTDNNESENTQRLPSETTPEITSSSSDSPDSSDAPDTPPAPVDDDWKFIQPEIDKLGLGQKALAMLRQRDPVTALALVMHVQEHGKTNPAGLLVTMLRNGQNPPDKLLKLAQAAIQYRALDRDTLDRQRRYAEAKQNGWLGEDLDGGPEAPSPGEPDAAALETFPDGAESDGPVEEQEAGEIPLPVSDVLSAPTAGETPPVEQGDPDQGAALKRKAASGKTWEAVWLHVVALLEKLNDDIKAHFADAEPLSLAEGVLTVRVATREAATFLAERLGPTIEKAATRAAGEPAKMVFVSETPEAPPVSLAVRWTEASGWREETALVESCELDHAAGRATLLLDFAELDGRSRYGWTALNELPPVRLSNGEGRQHAGVVQSVSRVFDAPGGAKVVVRLDESAEAGQPEGDAQPEPVGGV